MDNEGLSATDLDASLSMSRRRDHQVVVVQVVPEQLVQEPGANSTELSETHVAPI